MADPVVIEFISNTDKLQPAVPALEKIIESTEKIGNAAIVGHIKLDQMSESVKNLNKNVLANAGVQQMKKFTEEADKSAKEIEALKIEVAKLRAELDKLNPSLDKPAKGATTLVTQLRALKQELTLMEAAGKGSTKAFQDLSVQAAKLQDRIGDTQQRIRSLASDTKNLDAALSLASGLAGTFAVVQGATALFGKENEDLQKALLKVQASLAVLNGLQAISATLKKEDAFITRAQTIAQTTYNLVVGESVGVMKAFRLALAATGIGLLIVGIIALVENFDRLKLAIFGGVNPALKELAVEKQKLVDLSGKAAEGTSLEDAEDRIPIHFRYFPHRVHITL